MNNGKVIAARALTNSTAIMLDVAVALVPVIIWGVASFGMRALAVVLIASASAAAAEALMRLILRRKQRFTDLGALVSGMILGLTLPASVPFWIPALGGATASLLKQAFGGGRCPFNSIAAAHVVLHFVAAPAMNFFTEPFKWLPMSNNVSADAFKTPIEIIADGAMPSQTTLELLLGEGGGAIGETAAMFIILGALYMIYRRVISWHIPVTFIGAAALLFGFLPQSVDVTGYLFCEMLTGGIILAAVFAATDFSGAPVTVPAKLIFGAACGALTAALRFYVVGCDGAFVAVFAVSLLSRPLDMLFSRSHFGSSSKKKNAALLKKLETENN
jgi:electron transport complex protein RnfD